MAMFKELHVIEAKVIAAMEIVKEKAQLQVPVEAIIAACMAKSLEIHFQEFLFFAPAAEKELEAIMEKQQPEALLELFAEMPSCFTSFAIPSSEEVMLMAKKMEVIEE